MLRLLSLEKTILKQEYEHRVLLFSKSGIASDTQWSSNGYSHEYLPPHFSFFSLSSNDPGMDLSGLSDPFCVALWNGTEVGRTSVRHGTRDPNWAGDDSNGEFTSSRSAAVWLDLPFFVPEAEKWGEQDWPPMCLEVSSVRVSQGSEKSNSSLWRHTDSCMMSCRRRCVH